MIVESRHVVAPRCRACALLPAGEVGLYRSRRFGRQWAISYRAALAGYADIGVIDVEDEVGDANTAHVVCPCTRTGKHRSESEIAFRPWPAPGRVRRSRGDQDAGDLGIALDVAGRDFGSFDRSRPATTSGSTLSCS
jgi:hypothetical protein